MSDFDDRAYAELFDEFLRDQDGVLEDAVQGALAGPLMELVRELAKAPRTPGNPAQRAILKWGVAVRQQAHKHALAGLEDRSRRLRDDAIDRSGRHPILGDLGGV